MYYIGISNCTINAWIFVLSIYPYSPGWIHWHWENIMWRAQWKNCTYKRHSETGELWGVYCRYCQIFHIGRTLVGNKTVDHSDVVGASPVGPAPTTSSFSTEHPTSMAWAKTITRRDEKHLRFGIWWTYIRWLTVLWLPMFSWIKLER